MHNLRLTLPAIICTVSFALAASSSRVDARAAATDKVPVTTSSPEARDLYLKGRELAEKLRATDGRKFYEQAVAKDADFALAHLGLANTAGTTREFIDAVTRAAALAGRVSEGEKHMVLGLDAAMKGNVEEVLAHYKELVRLFPNDERAHTLLGNLHFGRQEYDAAVKEFVRATAIDPSFSQPYNQLGYAYRFLDKMDDAEAAFKKYVQLIPDDPNPHDSYAELLMKRGRFAESIAAYEKGAVAGSQLRRVACRDREQLPVRRADRSGPDGVRSHRGGRAQRRASGDWRASGRLRHTCTTARRTRRSRNCARSTRLPKRSGIQPRCLATSCRWATSSVRQGGSMRRWRNTPKR